nr:uncharacterized protein LOC127328365 [Lolium perenne]
MPPTRGTTSKDADIAGTNRSGCSAFARSSPKPKSLKPIHEGEEDMPASQHTVAAARSQPSGHAPRPPTQSCHAARTARAEKQKREPPLRPSRAAAEPTPHVNSPLAAGAGQRPDHQKSSAAAPRPCTMAHLYHGLQVPAMATCHTQWPTTAAGSRTKLGAATTRPPCRGTPEIPQPPCNRCIEAPPGRRPSKRHCVPGTAVPASPPPPCRA